MIGRGRQGLLHRGGDLVHPGLEHLAVQHGHQLQLGGVGPGAPEQPGTLQKSALAAVGKGQVDAAGDVIGQAAFPGGEGKGVFAHPDVHRPVDGLAAVGLLQGGAGLGPVHAGQVAFTHVDAFENIVVQQHAVSGIAAKGHDDQCQHRRQDRAAHHRGALGLLFGRRGGLALAGHMGPALFLILLAQCQSLRFSSRRGNASYFFLYYRRFTGE